MLDELGIKYGTDKASVYPFWNRMYSIDEFTHDYLRHYEKVFGKLKNEKFDLIEIGVLGGASLKMWKEYFPYARIVGVDINPDCAKYAEDRIEIVIMDGTTKKFSEYISSRYDNIRIIIDDGGHTWKMQQSSLEYLFPLLQRGGYYVIEDILPFSNKYDSDEPDGKSQHILNYLFDRVKYLSVISRSDQKLGMLREMSAPSRYISENLDSAYFMNSTCVLRKSIKEPIYSMTISGNVFREKYLLKNSDTFRDVLARQISIDGNKTLVVADCYGKYIGLMTAVTVNELLQEGTSLDACLEGLCNKNATKLIDFSEDSLIEAYRRTGHRYYPVVDNDGSAVGLRFLLEKDF